MQISRINFTNNSPQNLSGQIQGFSNKIGYPVFLGALTLRALINAFNNLAHKKNQPEPIQLSPAFQKMLDFSFLNGNLDLLAAFGDLGQPGSVIGNILRAGLNYLMSGDERSKLFAYQLFQLVAFMIKSSWAVTESEQLSTERHQLSSFGEKLSFELKNQVNWLKSFFNPETHKVFWKEVGRDFHTNGLRGLGNCLGHHTPGMISASAWTGLFATGILLLGGLQTQKAQKQKPIQKPNLLSEGDSVSPEEEPERNSLQKIGWFGIQSSMAMLTVSYLLKLFSKVYWARNKLLGVVLSGLTLVTQGFSIRFTDNPYTGQFWRVIYDFFSRLEALLNRHNHSISNGH
ncbi:MAG: hypothetical protein SFT81_01155 [Candidatus Caenarcaniphilales bacterium]|nr:hypothetical protein [Candidatus Caenarcaniphilales bacterium]